MKIYLQRTRAAWLQQCFSGFKGEVPLALVLKALGFVPSLGSVCEWIDGSAAAAEEALFQLFQLLKIDMPRRCDFEIECEIAIGRPLSGSTTKSRKHHASYQPAKLDSDIIKAAVNAYWTNLSTRDDAKFARNPAG